MHLAYWMQIDAGELQREVSVNPVLMQKANMNVSGDPWSQHSTDKTP